MNKRYYSLDVFRGATVCLMILVNNPGSWEHIFGPLEHAGWHGITPTDLVFPFFLFAVGNALAFVMPRLQAGGPAVFWRKVVVRSLLIFSIGLFLNWWPFVRWVNGEMAFSGWTYINAEKKLAGVRILGVLQRIAICYFLASVIIYYAKPRGSFLIGLLFLLLYWLLCVLGNPSDPYSLEGWFGTRHDLAILHDQHIYHGEHLNGAPFAFDPEGFVSTLPAVVQVIFGYLVGDYILKRSTVNAPAASPDVSEPVALSRQPAPPSAQPFNLYSVITGLFVGAMAFLVAGYAWSLCFPVNKKIWTSSYVMVTTGMATAILATLIYAIEGRGVRNALTRFFDVFGKNALFVFALSAFLPKGLRLIRIPNGTTADGKPAYLSPWNFLYDRVYRHIPLDPKVGSLLFALTVILFMWAVCYWMDKKRIYVKV